MLLTRSTIVRTIPHPLLNPKFIWLANSLGLYPTTPRITWLRADLGFERDTKPSFIWSALARMACVVHRANLHELFFISVATTAPRWEVNLVRQSSAPPAPW